ncbi:hypothetical protein IKQ26_09870 [bacterium]|nr:hypothetical protein [bacterium]
MLIPLKANALDIKNNYQGYVVQNQRFEAVEEGIKSKFKEYSITTKQIENVPNAYYEITPQGEHYYVRFYPAMPDTNIYIVSQDPFDLIDNKLTKTLDSLSYSYDILIDKKALREYKQDFIELARSGAFDGFFLLPDYIKPLKTTVSNVNGYVNKNHKRKTLAEYSPDEKEIYLTLLDTKEYQDEKDGIRIVSNEYRLKQKANKYVHSFEYNIYNESAEPITLKEVTGESVQSLRDVATSALADLDRLNLLDTAGTILAIPTGGTALALKIPNYLRILKMTKEAKRYTKGLPQNITIEQGEKLRILTLKSKQNPKPLNFTFEKDGKEFKVDF